MSLQARRCQVRAHPPIQPAFAIRAPQIRRQIELRLLDDHLGDPGPTTASLDDQQHPRQELAAERLPQSRPGAASRVRDSFHGLGLVTPKTRQKTVLGSTRSEAMEAHS
jgi:hypothetical protein